jgi:ribose transport system permease protein
MSQLTREDLNTAPPNAAAAWGRRAFRGALRGDNPLLLAVALIITIAVFAILIGGTGYLRPENLLGIVRQTATISVMAIATVFVISAREIDLSIAGVIPISAYVVALLIPVVGPLPATIIALAASAAIGLVNGLLVVGVGVPSFVVTLGMLGLLEGAARMFNNSQALLVQNSVFVAVFGSGSVFGIPVLALWSVGLAIVAAFVLKRTTVGKAVLATGGNPEAARVSGIRTARVRVGVLMLSSAAGGLAGLMYVGQFQSARFDLGSSDLLTVIAAAIIGGTLLSGGKGSVIGALIGSLLLGVVNNGLVILGLDAPQQLMFRGAIIIAAVIISVRAARRRF